MSTRSGKRIHNSPLEEAHIEEIPIPRRKTRNNKQKENCESIETVSKKKHYVRYPSEEESISGSQLQASKAKNLLRATLQEINVQQQIFEESDQKPIRTTRRTKKVEEDIPTEDVIVELKKKGKKKKISKKNSTTHDDDTNKNDSNIGKNKVSKKKKKKRSTSIVVEEVINPVLEKSNMSIDSFHSAAGSSYDSPDKNDNVETSAKNFLIDEDVTKNISPKLSNTIIVHCKKLSKVKQNMEDPDICTNSEGITEKNITKKKIRKQSLSPQANDARDEFLNKKINIQEEVEITNIKKGTKKKSKKTKQTIKETEIVTVLNSTFEKENIDSDKKDCTFGKEDIHNTTYDKESELITSEPNKKSISSVTSEKVNNISVSKEQKSNSLNSTYDKTPDLKTSCQSNENILNTTFEKQSMSINSTFEKDKINPKLNSTFEKVTSSPKTSSKFEKDKDSSRLNSTFDKVNEQSKLDATFDKSSGQSKKSSLLSSDRSNITDDKSNDSRISITSDESKENIVNTTPVLIESSIDESVIMEEHQSVENEKSPIDKSISKEKSPITPLKREGTFTKETNSPRTTLHQTPSKRASMPSPGRTPFPSSKSASKDKGLLNVTRSIEKSRRSSILDLPRATKVMFCSPVNNPIIASQMKGKVIKSNLKGSNKSFIFNESVSDPMPSARKRSYTHSEADEVTAKRKRLAEDLQSSVDRLSRPRTTSASGKLQDQTPTKHTPQKNKETKVSRTKLPNFAALHQKQFSKMESLDECQLRKAKRAQQMLAARNVSVERKSPKDKDAKPKETKKIQTPVKSKLPTLESLNPGYTRFGFKMNSDENPFANTTNTDFDSTKNDLTSTKNNLNSTKSHFNPKTDLNSTRSDLNVTKNGVNNIRTVKSVFNPPLNGTKTALKSQESKLNGLKRHTTLPSLAGTTARREVAKQTVMREKSFTERRNENRQENRTIIKGVRTNRRFELQMKSRNIN